MHPYDMRIHSSLPAAALALLLATALHAAEIADGGAAAGLQAVQAAAIGIEAGQGFLAAGAGFVVPVEQPQQVERAEESGSTGYTSMGGFRPFRTAGTVFDSKAAKAEFVPWTPGQGGADANAIDNYLRENGSPMAGNGRVFVAAGSAYHVDPLLVVAISRKESSLGKYTFKPHNAWGWGSESWANWNDAITNYTRLLGEEYISKGLKTPDRIGPKYCPGSASWIKDVTLFYQELIKIARR